MPKMGYWGEGSENTVITETCAQEILDGILTRLGPLNRVLLIPPDITRYHSWAGMLTCMLYERLSPHAFVKILPAIGTHLPMTPDELSKMFPGIPLEHFLVHRWRTDIVSLGEVPGDFVQDISNGRLDYSIPCYVNKTLLDGQWDRIFSIGQVVPHEVVGMANHNKNIFVGVGGQDTLNKTHFLGAVCDMEKIMGRAKTPVRDVFNYMSDNLIKDRLPITYLLTVRATEQNGHLVTRGLFAGDDRECFQHAAALSQKVNINLQNDFMRKVVVYLSPDEYKSTWLGNKSIYRTRMAIADNGELLVLAPGVSRFGEDTENDRLIRQYGYWGTPFVLDTVKQNGELASNLSVAAHLIHGSSEGRFSIAYCPGGLSQRETESAGLGYADLEVMMKRYSPDQLQPGLNHMPNGEEIFYISNPALGLWAHASRFKDK